MTVCFAASLFLVLVMVKALAATGGVALSEAPVLLCADAGLVLAFAALAWPLGALRLRGVVYVLLVVWVALQAPVLRLLGTPLTAEMLRAARGTLADSILHYATPVNLGLTAAVLLAGLALPRLLARLPRAATLLPLLLALATTLAGPHLPRTAATAGLERSTFLALMPRLEARWLDAGAGEDWRRSTEGEPGPDLRCLRGGAAGRDVVFVVLESTAAYALRDWGAAEDPMPNLTRLAQRALVVEHAYAVYPESIRAMLALFASRTPRLGKPAVEPARAPLPSLARSLAGHGYRTALFHSGRFDYLGMREAVGALGFELAEDAGSIGGERESSFGVDERATVARCLRWAGEQVPGERLALFWLPIAGHHPYDTPEPGPFTGEREIDAWRNALHYLDRTLGELWRGLEALGRAERALLVLVGDHGEAFGQHPRNVGHSFYLYEENVRVPLVVVAPGLFDRQLRTTTLASHVDVAPTVLDLLGLDSPGGFEGRSLLDGAPRSVLFLTDYALPWAGLRDGRFKVLLDLEARRCVVYDLVADPQERHDLSASLPEPVAAWRQRLERWVGQGRPGT